MQSSLKPLAVIVLSGLTFFAWVVQLARNDEPVGYITLTVLLMLAVLLVLGAVLTLWLLIFARWSNNRPRVAAHQQQFDPDVQQTQKLLRAQLQDMQYLLLQMQNNPELAHLVLQARQNPAMLTTGGAWTYPAPGSPGLKPGQLMTADGQIIDRSTFDGLDVTGGEMYDEAVEDTY